MRIRRNALTGILTLLVAFAVASPASAEPGNGAVVTESGCETFPDDDVNPIDGTICYDLRYVRNTTQTPSGNQSGIETGTASYEFTGSGYIAGCNWSGSRKFQHHYLIKDGTLHEQDTRNSFDRAFSPCSGLIDPFVDRPALTCTDKLHSHYANGQVQFIRPQFECTRTP